MPTSDVLANITGVKERSVGAWSGSRAFADDAGFNLVARPQFLNGQPLLIYIKIITYKTNK